MKARDIGLNVEAPKGECHDTNCVFHGTLSIRGRQFIGLVKGTKAQKTAVVEWPRLFFIPKYQRYERRKTKIHVHSPQCIDAKVGDKVLIAECRKISKTKSFVILSKVQK